MKRHNEAAAAVIRYLYQTQCMQNRVMVYSKVDTSIRDVKTKIDSRNDYVN